MGFHKRDIKPSGRTMSPTLQLRLKAQWSSRATFPKPNHIRDEMRRVKLKFHTKTHLSSKTNRRMDYAASVAPFS